LKKSEALVAEARAYAEDVIDTVRESLLVLDDKLRVRSANRSFYTTFGVSPEEALDKHLTEIGGGHLGAPALVQTIDGIFDGGPLEDLQIEVDLPKLGRRILLLNGRRITRDEMSTRLILLALLDITARTRAEEDARAHQKLREMAFDATLAEERERRRIATNLHDRIGQSLALAQMKVTSARAAATGELLVTLDEAVGLIEQSIADTRSVIFDLSPTILYDLGLPAALTWLAEQLEQQHGLRVELDFDADEGPIPGLLDEISAVLFRSVRELLMNVIKHARTASAKVSLRRGEDEIRVEVSDAGAGFDPSPPRSLSDRAGFGLFSVREQISHIGGIFEIQSAPGEGTRVSLCVPLDKRLREVKVGAS
jgi:PAS domain S-box-containing protein